VPVFCLQSFVTWSCPFRSESARAAPVVSATVRASANVNDPKSFVMIELPPSVFRERESKRVTMQ
jgi:hypothetical protein